MNRAENASLTKGLLAKGIASAILLFCFFITAYFVLKENGLPLSVDTTLRAAIIGIRSAVPTAILKSITFLANSQAIISWCILLLLFKNTRLSYGIPLSVASLCSVTIQTLIKNSIQRPRPDISDFLIAQGGFSFPSGHSCTGLVFFGLLIYLINRHTENKTTAKVLSVIIGILVFLIGISRIYLGVHYPSDVFAGWCIGGTILIASTTLYEKAEGRKTWRK